MRYCTRVTVRTDLISGITPLLVHGHHKLGNYEALTVFKKVLPYATEAARETALSDLNSPENKNRVPSTAEYYLLTWSKETPDEEDEWPETIVLTADEVGAIMWACVSASFDWKQEKPREVTDFICECAIKITSRAFEWTRSRIRSELGRGRWMTEETKAMWLHAVQTLERAHKGRAKEDVEHD